MTLEYCAQALVTLGLLHEGTVLTAAVAGEQIASRTLTGKELAARQESQRLARQQLGDDAYAAAVATGTAMTPEAAIAYALDVADRLARTAAFSADDER